MKCVVSGSFRKHYAEICETISRFEMLGVAVLSPKKSKIVNPGADFVFLETDQTKDAKALEMAHLEAIRVCDFLYVCNPTGYVGTSALLEIGFALACGKKVYCSELPQDQVLASFIAGIGTPDNIISTHVAA